MNPCSTYTFLLKSGAEKEISKDSVGLVHFTRHADFIELIAYADYHEIKIDVKLHGMDCVSNYKLFLCDDQQICHKIPVLERGNVTFDDLQDGRNYNYQLFGYDKNGMETYVSDTFSVKTLLNVTATFKAIEVQNTSMVLDFYTNIFDNINDSNTTTFTILVDCYDALRNTSINNQISNVKSITLKDMMPFTTYECTGQFQWNGMELFYDIDTISLTTLQGTYILYLEFLSINYLPPHPKVN